MTFRTLSIIKQSARIAEAADCGDRRPSKMENSTTTNMDDQVLRAMVIDYPDNFVTRPIWSQNVCVVISSGCSETHKVIHIHGIAFTPCNTKSGIIKKSVVRKHEESLCFGAEISFKTSDITCVSNFRGISEFTRISRANRSLFPVRSGMQIRIPCVLNKEKNALFNAFFDVVQVANSKEVRRAISGVPLYAWISINFSEDLSCIKPQFIEFDDEINVEDNEFIVTISPWYVPKFCVSDESLDDLEAKLIDVPENPKIVKEGVYLGNNQVILLSKDGIVAYLPVTSKVHPIMIGKRLLVTLYKSYAYSDRFLISKFRTLPNADVFESTRLGQHYYLEVDICEEEHFPGVFISEIFGRVADPNRILVVNHMSKFSNSMIKVFIKVARFEQYANFAIQGMVIQKQREMVENVIENCSEFVIQGVICDRDGKYVFCTKHATIIFRYDETTCQHWSYFKPGTRIKALAKLVDVFKGEAAVLRLRPRLDQQPISYVEYESDIAFQAQASTLKRLSIGGAPLLYSDDFGVLCDTYKQLNSEIQDQHVIDVWIGAKDDACPVAFEILWHGRAPPQQKELPAEHYLEIQQIEKQLLEDLDLTKILELGTSADESRFLRQAKYVYNKYQTKKCCTSTCTLNCQVKKFFFKVLQNLECQEVLKSEPYFFVKILNLL